MGVSYFGVSMHWAALFLPAFPIVFALPGVVYLVRRWFKTSTLSPQSPCHKIGHDPVTYTIPGWESVGGGVRMVCAARTITDCHRCGKMFYGGHSKSRPATVELVETDGRCSTYEVVA